MAAINGFVLMAMKGAVGSENRMTSIVVHLYFVRLRLRLSTTAPSAASERRTREGSGMGDVFGVGIAKNIGASTPAEVTISTLEPSMLER